MKLRSGLLTACEGVVHGFTGDAWDLGAGASPRVWADVAEALGATGFPVALASQVHGAEVLQVRAGGSAGEGDALVTRERGLLLAVRVADCVPVLVVGEEGVAAIHAGWRGLAAGVIPAALDRLGPASVAAVGPCICGDCYQVGPEVIEGISPSVPEEEFARESEGRLTADLRQAARWQLLDAGVGQVDVLDACTRCSLGFHSYRRDGAASGRQAGIVGLLC